MSNELNATFRWMPNEINTLEMENLLSAMQCISIKMDGRDPFYEQLREVAVLVGIEKWDHIEDSPDIQEALFRNTLKQLESRMIGTVRIMANATRRTKIRVRPSPVSHPLPLSSISWATWSTWLVQIVSTILFCTCIECEAHSDKN